MPDVKFAAMTFLLEVQRDSAWRPLSTCTSDYDISVVQDVVVRAIVDTPTLVCAAELVASSGVLPTADAPTSGCDEQVDLGGVHASRMLS